MSWFDNQNNVILLILIAIVLYFMMQKDKFSTIKTGKKLCRNNTNCSRREYCFLGECVVRT